jgi:SAM-dependent methyltransferase
MSKSHDSLVVDQFGPRANAYVTSTVHAAGEDLDQVERILAARKPDNVLDLGCGGGHLSYRAAPHARAVTAYDLSADMVAAVADNAAAKGLNNITVRQGPAEKLPFADVMFDMVLCRFTAHHWHDFAAGLREARRVIRPGGYAVFIDVVSPGRPALDTYLQTVESLRDTSHVRDYSTAEWSSALAAAGFGPGPTTPRRLWMDFPSWIARMNTPDVFAQAIRAYQAKMSADVVRHFAISADGGFFLDTLTMECTVS